MIVEMKNSIEWLNDKGEDISQKVEQKKTKS